jgi:hypothetical protein
MKWASDARESGQYHAPTDLWGRQPVWTQWWTISVPAAWRQPPTCNLRALLCPQKHSAVTVTRETSAGQYKRITGLTQAVRKKCTEGQKKQKIHQHHSSSLETILSQVRFQVLAATSTRTTVFWDVGPRNLVDADRRFRCAYCLHHRWLTVSTSETLVNFYQTTRPNIPEDSHLHSSEPAASTPHPHIL